MKVTAARHRGFLPTAGFPAFEKACTAPSAHSGMDHTRHQHPKTSPHTNIPSFLFPLFFQQPKPKTAFSGIKLKAIRLAPEDVTTHEHPLFSFPPLFSNNQNQKQHFRASNSKPSA
jgi:hypothetical protein